MPCVMSVCHYFSTSGECNMQCHGLYKLPQISAPLPPQGVQNHHSTDVKLMNICLYLSLQRQKLHCKFTFSEANFSSLLQGRKHFVFAPKKKRCGCNNWLSQQNGNEQNEKWQQQLYKNVLIHLYPGHFIPELLLDSCRQHKHKQSTTDKWT